jgi:hypothetical protein
MRTQRNCNKAAWRVRSLELGNKLALMATMIAVRERREGNASSEGKQGRCKQGVARGAVQEGNGEWRGKQRRHKPCGDRARVGERCYAMLQQCCIPLVALCISS